MSEAIVAAATPQAPSAIGILRLSGDGVIPLVDRLFTPRGGCRLAEAPDRTLLYGTLYDGAGRPLDQALATVSRGPHSYTGEDTAEVQCHGSPAVLALALNALCAAGARMAQPGEFTRRAFLNGKLDLTAAEAVMDLIDAETEEAVHQAAGQLSGALCRKIDGIYDVLVDVMAHFHAVLDYPDEDIDPFRMEALAETLTGQARALDALLAACGRGRQLREGVPCAIVGRPNAGKSSLLNTLVGYDRAIVTDIPGTTRDTVEERCTLGGVTLRLIDTAGLRESADPVEQLGVARSRAAMEGAELIFVLWDSAAPATEEDAALLEQARAIAPTVLVRTKTDLPAAPAPFPALPAGLPVVELSAKTGQGLDALGAAVAALFPRPENIPCGQLLTNARQEDAARRSRDSIGRARDALTAGMTPDALLTDVEEALSALGELTGKTVRSDITDRIFSRFCVGK